MDAELKDLLTRLLDKLDAMDARLKIVEAKAHDQVNPTIVIQHPIRTDASPFNNPLQFQTIC